MTDHSFQPTDALVLIDIQNDFCPGGALAVPGGDDIIPGVNRLIDSIQSVILSQDWHPADHRSFAAQHPGKAPYDTVEMPYGTQVLWPTHCVQGTRGAEFHPRLNATKAEMVIRKGYRTGIDSYSAFYENDKTTSTGLAGYLRDRGFHRLYFAGLATDFCVAASAIDAVRCGFESVVVHEACRGIDTNGSMADAHQRLTAAGVMGIYGPV